jgi:hypothetical protein
MKKRQYATYVKTMTVLACFSRVVGPLICKSVIVLVTSFVCLFFSHFGLSLILSFFSSGKKMLVGRVRVLEGIAVGKLGVWVWWWWGGSCDLICIPFFAFAGWTLSQRINELMTWKTWKVGKSWLSFCFRPIRMTSV